MLNNLRDSLTMVESAGAKNGGIIVDIVHVMNIGITNEELSRIPPQYLINIELNDGALKGSPLYDPSRERRYCGEGDFDIKGFIRRIQNTGYTGPWAVEVFSRELDALSLDELNQRAFESTIAQFEDYI